jgi:sterol desaturase/sphingolipid hydroxylase (fatty acid hydroxylase superfamily)
VSFEVPGEAGARFAGEAGRLRAAVGAAVVPLALVGSLLAAAQWIAGGVEPAAVVFPLTLANIALVALLERALPYRGDWLHSDGELLTDALYWPASFVVLGLSGPAVATLAVVVGGWLSASAGVGLWPHAWPLAAQVVLACVVAEFFDYWAHRAMHHFDLLWRLHATHHSARRVYWVNGLRIHPVEMLFRFGLVGVLPLAVLGAGAPVLALAAVATGSAGMFQHANIDMRLGPLSWIFAIGDLHRWHHSRDREQAYSNFGNNFIFWDAVFGTRHLPEHCRAPFAVGIDGLDAFPRRFFAQWIAPLQWSRIESESATALARAQSRRGLQ